MALREAKIWVPSKEHAWVCTDVVAFIEEGDLVQVIDPENPAGDNLVLQQKQTHLLDPSHLILHNDLCDMNRLHDAPLLDVLRRRYIEDTIYSTTSDMILVSVNPYKAITGLYDNPLRFFDIPPEGEKPSAGAMPPHVYKVANHALYALINPSAGGDGFRSRYTNQSIVVSGESGAGKTEASKRVMSYLVAANLELVKRVKSTTSEHELEEIASKIQREVVGSNFVFEAFGNAKTVRNDNSSRFGKYIKLQYNNDNVLLSAYTDTFLLEKSRILSVNSGESNYHAFYYLVNDMQKLNPAMAEELGLTGTTFDNFQILLDGHAKCYWTDRAEEENLGNLMTSLDNVDFSKEEQSQIFRLLAVVLHLGNVSVSVKEDVGGAKLDCLSISLERLSELLGLTEQTLFMKLTQRVVRIRGRSSMATKQLNEKEIKNNLAAFIKMIYTGVFSYIVRKINFAHSHPDQRDGMQPKKFIGILDIFGFEIFQYNSFEQLCINFANERLQQHFNEHVFVSEKEEYMKEGLDSSFITFSDNQDIIDLVTKKPSGLFCVLDDFAKVNKTEDTQLIINFHQLHGNGDKNSRYIKPRLNHQECFVLQHFAGSVTYTIGEGVDSFLFKNNDALEEGLSEGVAISTNEFFRNIGSYIIGLSAHESGELGFVPDLTENLFGEMELKGINDGDTRHIYSASGNELPPAPTQKAKDSGSSTAMAASNTVSKRFISQVNRLMATLQVTEPHYIKCMKPNTSKKAGMFVGPLMLEQLRYSGVLEVVRIRREGFPWKSSYLGFYKEFDVLTVKKQISGKYPAPADCSEERAREIASEMCATLLSQSDESGENAGKALFAFGVTRMYMREEGYNAMSHHLNVYLDKCAAVVQADIRRFRAVVAYKRARRLIIRLQAWARMKAKVSWKAAELKRLAHLAAVEAARLQAEEDERRRLAAIAAAEARRLAALELAKQQLEDAELRRLAAIAAAEEAECARIEAERLRVISEREAIRQAAEDAENLRIRLEQEAIDADKLRLHDFTLAVEQGNVAKMKEMLSLYPDLATRKSEETGGPKHTAFQNACVGCSLQAMKFLNPAPHEIHATDSAGYNSLLLALSTPSTQDCGQLLDICQYLSKACCENFPIEDAFETDDYLISRADKWATADVNSIAFNAGVDDRETTGAVLKEGWLSKMNNTYLFTASWVKRWIRLTDTSLLYFKQPDDSLPKDSVQLTKGTVKGMTLDFFEGPGGPAVKIGFSSAVKSEGKGRTQISLMAVDQVEMEQWARPLKAIMGMINEEQAMNEDLANNWQFVNPREKKVLLDSVTSRSHHTALHVLAQKDGTVSEENNSSCACVAAWLVAGGLLVNATNSSDLKGEATISEVGVTAIHLAAHHKNLPLCTALMCLGAHMEGRAGGKNLSQLITENFGKVGFNSLQATAARYCALPRPLAPPPQLKLYTYLSMFFQKNTFTKEITSWSEDTKIYEPVLVISVVNRAHGLVENSQIVSVPIMKNSNTSIWWGKTWHLQTPLDNAPNDSSVIIEVRSNPDPMTYTLLGWCFHKLNHTSVTTSADPTVMKMHQWTGQNFPSVFELSTLIPSLTLECVAGTAAGNSDKLEVEVVCSRRT